MFTITLRYCLKSDFQSGYRLQSFGKYCKSRFKCFEVEATPKVEPIDVGATYLRGFEPKSSICKYIEVEVTLWVNQPLRVCISEWLEKKLGNVLGGQKSFHCESEYEATTR